ncbi:Macrolide export protein MacA [compost metagenome]
MKTRMKRALIAGAVLGVLGFGTALVLSRSESAPPSTAVVQTGNVEQTVLATGRIRAAQLVDVGAQVTGQVIRLHVKLGDVVSKGQPIAEIDALPQRNALRNASAQVRSAAARLKARQATLRQLRLEAERQAVLMTSDSTARAQFESAQAAFAAARAEVDALEADAEQARIAAETAELNLSYTRVTAPMDGVVVAVVTEQGQTVNANQSAPTIVKLADLQTMVIKAQVSEADIAQVAPGMPAYFTLMGPDDRRHQATLTEVEPGPVSLAQQRSDDPSASGTDGGGSKAVYYNAILRVPNPDRQLRIDMTARTTIVVAEATEVLMVPSAAITVDVVVGTRSARVLRADGGIEHRILKIGLDNRNMTEVKSGLRRGERVLLGEGRP